jgi:hypothetical protein
MVRDLIHAVIRDVGHHDPPDRRRLQVDRVEADTRADDDLAALPGAQDVRAELRVDIQGGVALAAFPLQGVGIGPGRKHEVGVYPTQLLLFDLGIREDRVGHQDAELAHWGSSL